MVFDIHRLTQNEIQVAIIALSAYCDICEEEIENNKHGVEEGVLLGTQAFISDVDGITLKLKQHLNVGVPSVL